MSRGEILPTTRHRILPDPGLRAVSPDCDSILGVILDQHGIFSGARLHRTADCTHDFHDEWRCQGHTTQSVLY